ncbi:MAG: hypothetical protein ACLUGQ_12210 [Coprococcus sp.]
MKKLLLALASLILVCSITACDKQADSSTVEEDSVKTDISNNEIAVRMDAFSVDGYEMGLPCTIGDFIEHFELEYSFPMPDCLIQFVVPI